MGNSPQQAPIHPLRAIHILRTAIQGMATLFGKSEVGQQALDLTESVQQAPGPILSDERIAELFEEATSDLLADDDWAGVRAFVRAIERALAAVPIEPEHYANDSFARLATDMTTATTAAERSGLTGQAAFLRQWAGRALALSQGVSAVLGKEPRRAATDAEIAEWADRHDIANMLGGSARAAFEDAESLHMTYAPDSRAVPRKEPVAWVRRHPDGALTAEYLEDGVIEPVRRKSGAWLPMYLGAAPVGEVVSAPPEPKLTRYELNEHQRGSGHMIYWEKTMDEAPDGEWVRFADLAALPPQAPATSTGEAK